MSEDLIALLKELQQRYQISEAEMEAVGQAIETEIAEASGDEMPMNGENVEVYPEDGVEY